MKCIRLCLTALFSILLLNAFCACTGKKYAYATTLYIEAQNMIMMALGKKFNSKYDNNQEPFTINIYRNFVCDFGSTAALKTQLVSSKHTNFAKSKVVDKAEKAHLNMYLHVDTYYTSENKSHDAKIEIKGSRLEISCFPTSRPLAKYKLFLVDNLGLVAYEICPFHKVGFL